MYQLVFIRLDSVHIEASLVLFESLKRNTNIKNNCCLFLELLHDALSEYKKISM